MPKRTDIQSILIIGAGPIVIGQACEFDYSGTQACKALKQEGYRVVLINSNPATIMTDSQMADATYIEPIAPEFLERIIEKERPDAILPTMGGQTALNSALELDRLGILERYGVELIGANRDAIDRAEDRGRFKEAMNRIGLKTPVSFVAHTIEEALRAQVEVSFPTLIRPSFTMGGSGGGIAYNQEEFIEICERGFDASPTHEILIEQSIFGWKEFEMEVIRDRNDNCIIVCSIENLDPVGIHTGDSITVAPAQTLTDKEYQTMRDASISVLREIGVETGGSNVQFAINPENGDMILIEMNPRVSRSSALASKATGFPIAKVAAKLAVGYTLDELENDITGGRTPASFEPAIDYVVTKIPRFAFEKFPSANKHLTTQMKSVGEAMAIGRTFQESIHKALRSLETDLSGFDPRSEDRNEILSEISNAGPDRILYLADAFRIGCTVEEIFEISGIDPWFLSQIREIVDFEDRIARTKFENLLPSDLRFYKSRGFSDRRLSRLCSVTEDEVRELRWNLDIHPVFKRVDTCAAEFETPTAYLYSTYETECEARPSRSRKIIVLGGGPNRIGQGIEFDYCCVHASMALRECGYESIMINCNPETVSTDYDTSDRLYFEPLTLEDVLEICRVESPDGVMVQYGGQTPLKLARALERNRIKIIGTCPDSIDLAEDRERFKNLLEELNIVQTDSATAKDAEQAIAKANQIGYPLVVRPSYVLGGRAMEIVHTQKQLETYIREAVQVSDSSPVLLDRFLNDAIEVDVDAIRDSTGEVLVGGIMQHIEKAGIHSGDSACSLPPYSLSDEVLLKIKKHTVDIAHKLNVIGLMNIQFALCEGEIYVLEVNPRVSRTVPFVSKASNRVLAKIAARCMVGISLKEQKVTEEVRFKKFAVKEAVFPFIKFPSVDTILGPEMKSTGEVMCFGETFAEAFIKAQIAAGEQIPRTGKVFLSLRDEDKAVSLGACKLFLREGFDLCATKGTARALMRSYESEDLDLNAPLDPNARVFKIETVNKVIQGRPHIVDAIKNGEIQIVINTVSSDPQSIQDSYQIRRSALHLRIPQYTNITSALALAQGISYLDKLKVYCLQNDIFITPLHAVSN